MNPFVWLMTEIQTIYNLRKNNPQVFLKFLFCDFFNSIFLHYIIKIKKRDYIQILLETQTDQKISLSPQSVNTSQSHDFSKMHFERKMTPEVNILFPLFI